MEKSQGRNQKIKQIITKYPSWQHHQTKQATLWKSKSRM